MIQILKKLLNKISINRRNGTLKEHYFGSHKIMLPYDHPLDQYQKTKELKAGYVVPAVMDFLVPTPALGINSGPCEDDGCIVTPGLSAKKRFKSDLVLALALIHHLVFFQKVSFEEIVKQLKSFTNKHLILEFVCPTDDYVKGWMNESFNWYSFENLKKALEQEFTILKIEETLKNRRALIFCRVT